MAQADRATYYQALKAEGVQFDKHFREYTTDDLAGAWDELRSQRPELPETPASAQREAPKPRSNGIQLPVKEKDPTVMAGELLVPEGEPIRQDEKGRVWYVEEIRKPAGAQPRGRRILRYDNPGVRQETVTSKDGSTETFEMPGTRQSAGEIKITLPSYQVGQYRDPRFPFMVHVYNGQQGFDLFEVQAFYGGAELVPEDIKRKYIENVLCYDIRTVVREIQKEHRQLQLAGKVK